MPWEQVGLLNDKAIGIYTYHCNYKVSNRVENKRYGSISSPSVASARARQLKSIQTQ